MRLFLDVVVDDVTIGTLEYLTNASGHTAIRLETAQHALARALEAFLRAIDTPPPHPDERA